MRRHTPLLYYRNVITAQLLCGGLNGPPFFASGAGAPELQLRRNYNCGRSASPLNYCLLATRSIVSYGTKIIKTAMA